MVLTTGQSIIGMREMVVSTQAHISNGSDRINAVSNLRSRRKQANYEDIIVEKVSAHLAADFFIARRRHRKDMHEG